MNRKICFFLDEPIFKYKSNYYSSSTWLLFILNFSKSISTSVTVFSPVKVLSKLPSKLHCYSPVSCHIEFFELPFYDSFRSFSSLPLTFLFRQLKSVNRALSNFSHIVVRAPNVNIFFFNLFIFLLRRRIDSKLYLVMSGNILTQASVASPQNFIKYLISKLFISLIANSESLFSSTSHTLFLYGDELLKRFSCIRQPQKVITRTPLFLTAPSDKLSTPFLQLPSVKLLRVCSVIPSKNILLFIRSFDLIKNSYPSLDITATIVGPHKDKEYLDLIRNEINELRLNEHLFLSGQIPFGPELFKIYQTHDVQFMTSSSEGIPRVLLEGDTHGLPLISTNVGGIPSFYIHNHNCLISDSTPESFCYQFSRLFNSPDLRKRLVSCQLSDSSMYTFPSVISQYSKSMGII